MESNMTNDMHLGIERMDFHHPSGVSSESNCCLSAGVPLHSTTCLSSVVPTGLQRNPVGVTDVKQVVSTPAFTTPESPLTGVTYTDAPLIIAGPCSVESEEQIMATAQALAQIPEVKMLRGGIWKPRTRPDAFEGRGEQGLEAVQIEKMKTEDGVTWNEVDLDAFTEACAPVYDWIVETYGANPDLHDQLVKLISDYRAGK